MRKQIIAMIALLTICIGILGSGRVSVMAASFSTGAKTTVSKDKVTSGTIKLSWKMIAGCDGYEVQYATDSLFVYSLGTETTEKTELIITNLLEKRKHYIRVRAYKTIDGERVYSKWSKVVSAKTKDNKKTDSDTEVKNRIKAIVNEITTEDMTDVEKLYALQKWMATYISYDQSLSAYTTYEAILEGKGICKSYTDSTQLILDEMGIPCKTFYGTVGYPGYSTFGHAWNTVKVNGKWYIYDITLADSFYGEAMTKTIEQNGWNFYPANFLVPYDYVNFAGQCLSDYYHCDTAFPKPAGKKTEYVDWAISEAKQQITQEIVGYYEARGYHVYIADEFTDEILNDIEEHQYKQVILISRYVNEYSYSSYKLQDTHINSIVMDKKLLGSCSYSIYAWKFTIDQ